MSFPVTTYAAYVTIQTLCELATDFSSLGYALQKRFDSRHYATELLHVMINECIVAYA